MEGLHHILRGREGSPQAIKPSPPQTEQPSTQESPTNHPLRPHKQLQGMQPDTKDALLNNTGKSQEDEGSANAQTVQCVGSR